MYCTVRRTCTVFQWFSNIQRGERKFFAGKLLAVIEYHLQC
jgi:hypothetical protein